MPAPGIKIGFRLKHPNFLFFDAPKVLRHLDPITRRAFSMFGAFVRTHVQTTMLRHKVKKKFGIKTKVSNREGVSPPGQPPFVHTGTLVKNIYFAIDWTIKTVVIGATLVNQVAHSAASFKARAMGRVPEILEHGGRISIFETEIAGEWFRADLRSPRRNATRPQRWRNCKVAPRPYMQPAFDAELSNLPDIWRRARAASRAAA